MKHKKTNEETVAEANVLKILKLFFCRIFFYFVNILSLKAVKSKSYSVS